MTPLREISKTAAAVEEQYRVYFRRRRGGRFLYATTQRSMFAANRYACGMAARAGEHLEIYIAIVEVRRRVLELVPAGVARAD